MALAHITVGQTHGQLLSALSDFFHSILSHPHSTAMGPHSHLHTIQAHTVLLFLRIMPICNIFILPGQDRVCVESVNHMSIAEIGDPLGSKMEWEPVLVLRNDPS